MHDDDDDEEYVSDTDRDDTDPEEEDEELDENPEDQNRIKALQDAKKVIEDAGKESEGEALTAEKVTEIWDGLCLDVLARVGETRATSILHAVVEIVASQETIYEKVTSKTVGLLVERLVQEHPHLLCVLDEKGHNPLYAAITGKKDHRELVSYMIHKSCLKEPESRQHLARALEASCGNAQEKTCLHLALEADGISTKTLLRMVQAASSRALESVDKSRKRPMHYAVQYTRCDVGIIEEFIKKDSKALAEHKRRDPGRRVFQTFLDMDERGGISVYQEHIASAPVSGVGGDEQTRKDKMEDNKNKKNAFPTQAIQPKIEPKPNIREEQVSVRDPRTKLDRGTERRDWELEAERRGGQGDATADREARENHRQALKEKERREMAKMAPPSTHAAPAGGFGTSADAAAAVKTSAGTRGVRPLHIQTSDMHGTSSERGGSDIAANTPLRRVPTVRFDAPAEGKTERAAAKKSGASSKKSTKSTKLDPLVTAARSKIVLRLLKLHYMRTRSLQQATAWLYGTNPKGM